MKKLLALILAAALVLSLAACGGSAGNNHTSGGTSKPEETETTIEGNSVVGTWTDEVKAGESTEDFQITISFTIELHKG